VQILRGPGGTSRGCGFVHMRDPRNGDDAISKLSAKQQIEGATRALFVTRGGSKNASQHVAGTRVFVANISRDSKEEDLRKRFSEYGEITEIYLMKEYKEFRKTALLIFESKDGAERAIHDIHGKIHDGTHPRPLIVRLADSSISVDPQTEPYSGKVTIIPHPSRSYAPPPPPVVHYPPPMPYVVPPAYPMPYPQYPYPHAPYGYPSPYPPSSSRRRSRSPSPRRRRSASPRRSVSPPPRRNGSQTSYPRTSSTHTQPGPYLNLRDNKSRQTSRSHRSPSRSRSRSPSPPRTQQPTYATPSSKYLPPPTYGYVQPTAYPTYPTSAPTYAPPSPYDKLRSKRTR